MDASVKAGRMACGWWLVVERLLGGCPRDLLFPSPCLNAAHPSHRLASRQTDVYLGSFCCRSTSTRSSTSSPPAPRWRAATSARHSRFWT